MRKIIAGIFSLLSFGAVWAITGIKQPSPVISSLEIPAVGHVELKVISPRILELMYVNTVDPGDAPSTWNWVDEKYRLRLPAFNELQVQIDGLPAKIDRWGFKRRVLYGSHKQYDLRIGNYLYIELESEIPDDVPITLIDIKRQLGLADEKWQASSSVDRISPVIHVNQNGYYPVWSKKAMVGYYLGSLGELPLPLDGAFQIESNAGKVVFEGILQHRPDKGYEYDILPYQYVLEADFSALDTPGLYRLRVPGLGVSSYFLIDEGIPAMMARTYALGLYHQRCGTENLFEFSRFTHEACHVAPAEIPTLDHKKMNAYLKGMSKPGRNETPRAAPIMSSVEASLYPIRKTGTVSVKGGHHDAGDYSKYTIHSAQFIHHLTFAVDALSGIADLDNLGLPESGDGISDMLQMANREADFLLRMQDDDGGFFFLVYPRDRRYETDVLPDKGDPQVVFPKNTAGTAAAAAALAQIGSSPLFRQTYPDQADRYLSAATKGWLFLESARQRHGVEGAYQKISHYGDVFQDADETAWAATELYLATGEEKYHDYLLKNFNPADRKTQRWGWVRLYEGYGNAIRSYAFSEKTGRLPDRMLDKQHLERSVEQITAAGRDQADFAIGNAYGISFPFETKRFKTAGWFLAMDTAYDMVVAGQLNDDQWLTQILTNAAYEGGTNPNNMAFVTGSGLRHPIEIVHQYAQNDDRFLPPSGIPVGNIQRSFEGHKPYGRYLNDLSFPHDDDDTAPYPFYDRYGDTFNTRTEGTIVKQARALAAYAYLMAKTDKAEQQLPPAKLALDGWPEKPVRNASYSLTLKATERSMEHARIVWETSDGRPYLGDSYTFKTESFTGGWIEAEVLWPDGKRAYLRKEFNTAWW